MHTVPELLSLAESSYGDAIDSDTQDARYSIQSESGPRAEERSQTKIGVATPAVMVMRNSGLDRVVHMEPTQDTNAYDAH